MLSGGGTDTVSPTEQATVGKTYAPCFLNIIVYHNYYNINIGSESARTATDAGGETAATPLNIKGSYMHLMKDLSAVYWSIVLPVTDDEFPGLYDSQTSTVNDPITLSTPTDEGTSTDLQLIRLG
jgi:hypothetical protein